jgi:hypothetical protein
MVVGQQKVSKMPAKGCIRESSKRLDDLIAKGF